MMRGLLIFLWCFTTLELRAKIPDEAKSCYEWFGTLGFPGVKDARWAEIWSGSYYTTGGSSKPEVQTFRGFVIEEQNDRFRVMSMDMLPRWLTRTGVDKPAHERVGFEERPFAEMAKNYIEALRHPPRHASRFGCKLGQLGEVFALSYICWQKGDDDMAGELFEEAVKLSTRMHGEDGKEIHPGMRVLLEIEFGHEAMWDAVLHVGGGSLGEDNWCSGKDLMPRTGLLELFREVIRKYPASPHVERAKKSVAILERMVEEDAAHRPLDENAIKKLPVEHQVREWIFRLRDQHGRQSGQPGWCDIFGGMSYSGGNSPADQLVKIGYDAVPQLIDALSDERFSRSVGFHRDFHFSHTILTIGDCAQQVLNHIAGRAFYAPRSTSSYMSRDEEIAATQKVAREWWNEFQKKGDVQMMIDGISSGREQPSSMVEKLKAKRPEALQAALLAGADNAKDSWLRSNFIEQLGKLDSKPVTARLLKFMHEDSELRLRLSAARELHNRDHPEALPAVIKEWEKFTAAPVSKQSGEGMEEMVELLLASGEADAIKALSNGWSGLSTYNRLTVVEHMGSMLGVKDDSPGFWEPKRNPPSRDARTLATALLVRALMDTAVLEGMSGSRGELSYTNPRVCDFAAWALHRIEPGTYAFSVKAGKRKRDEERIASANVWRKSQNLELLPVPVNTLPVLEPEDAMKITVVKVTGEVHGADKELRKIAEELKGSRFTARTLPTLLMWYVGNEPQGIQGMNVEANRDSDLRGVELEVTLIPGAYPTAGGSWSHHHSGEFGSKSIGNSAGSSSISSPKEERFWKDFEDDVADALKIPAETEFQIHAGLRSDD